MGKRGNRRGIRELRAPPFGGEGSRLLGVSLGPSDVLPGPSAGLVVQNRAWDQGKGLETGVGTMSAPQTSYQ